MKASYYRRFKLFTQNPLWKIYLFNSYKKSERDLAVLNQKHVVVENYVALLCGTSGASTSKSFIKFVLNRYRDSHAYILDASNIPLEESRDIIAKQYPNAKVSFLHRNALSTGLCDSSVDYIETDSFFQFFDSKSLVNLFQEWNRILKPTGYISTRCFASSNSIGRGFDRLRLMLGKYLNVRFHIHHRIDIAHAIQRAGFIYVARPSVLPTLTRFTIAKPCDRKGNYAVVFNSDSYFLPGRVREIREKCYGKIDCIYEVPFAASKQYLLANMRIVLPQFSLKILVGSLLNTVLGYLPLPVAVSKNVSIRKSCAYHGLNHTLIDSVNDPEFINSLRINRIATVFSFGSEIYKPNTLREMAGKIYNFHPGILPNNKGRFPIFWAILKGESQGVTCHEIGDKVDSGEILFQYALEMQSGTMETILCAYIRSFPILLQQAIVHMEQKRSPQISKGIPSYYGSTPSVKDIKQYRRIVKN